MRKGISLLKGLLGGYALTIGLLLLLTLLVYRFRMPETGVHVGICTIYVLACFLAGLLCGRQMVNRRFLWGMLAGGLYFAVLFLAFYFPFSLYFLLAESLTQVPELP